MNISKCKRLFLIILSNPGGILSAVIDIGLRKESSTEIAHTSNIKLILVKKKKNESKSYLDINSMLPIYLTLTILSQGSRG